MKYQSFFSSGIDKKYTGWWAKKDFPLRFDSKISYLIDGRSILYEMCISFLTAKKYIYLANWGMTLEYRLVRGKDHIIGDEGSAERNKLIEDLKLRGLGDKDIEFWFNSDLTLKSVLKYVATKSIDVRVLLWQSYNLPLVSFYNPFEVSEDLKNIGIKCLTDDSAIGIMHHQIESLHQKSVVIDGTSAFIGGLDPMTQTDDKDRWDMPSHSVRAELRGKEGDKPHHPWHDSQAFIVGDGVKDVEINFIERWNYVVKRHRLESSLLLTSSNGLNPSIKSNSIVQVVRTIPPHTYSFKNHRIRSIRGIRQIYLKAIKNAHEYIYIENQYLWINKFMAIDIPFIRIENREMRRIFRALANALRRGVKVIMILPDKPNIGRNFTDLGIRILKDMAGERYCNENLYTYSLGNSAYIENQMVYRPIYVHSKLAIVDDKWVTVGSANLNNRGMRDDTEINVAVIDTVSSRNLRFLCWAEHLSLLESDELFLLTKYLQGVNLSEEDKNKSNQMLKKLENEIGNYEKGLKLFEAKSKENLVNFKNNKEFNGHLVPYITFKEASEYQLPFNTATGWIESKDIFK